MYLDELTDDALAFIHELAMARPDPSVLIHVPIMGGATAAVAAEDTAFGDRSAPFMVSFDGGTYDPAKFDEVRDWVRATIEAARRLDGAGGAYLNFSGDEERTSASCNSSSVAISNGCERSRTSTTPTTSSASTTTSSQM